MSKRLKVAAAIVVALFAILFAVRGAIVRSYINKKIAAIENRYPIRVDYDKLHMSGLSSVSIEGLSICQIGSDTLLSSKNIEVSVSPIKLIVMKVDINGLDLDRLHIDFIKRDSTSNYDFMYKDLSQIDSLEITKEVLNVNFSRKADRIFGILFGLVPSRASINDLKINYTHDLYNLSIAVDSMNIRDKKFRTEIIITEDDSCQRWISEGKLIDSERNMHLKLYSEHCQKVTIPFLSHRLGAEVAFDTIALNFIQQRIHAQTVIEGQATVSGLTVKHDGLSPNAVLLDKGNFDYRFNIGSNSIELDSATTVQFNKLRFNPYILVERGENWHFKMCIDKRNFPADDLFSSLPRGLFLNLEGIQTEGQLSYHLLFDLDMANIDSLKLESQLKREKFRIKQYGNTDLRRMNSPFMYTAYERGVALRTFEVGEANPNFRTLDAISPLLQMTVMQSEDGAFFYHNGFLLDCLRDALVNDIKIRRFARGGSTISMQLVKNVFLSRHKTIARKVEEALIVWLIECNRLSSKERMFEVYMNIIEWGPMIYGANEAAHFYFDKEASELDLNESIFLASIIPSPKRALNAFDENMQLKPHFEGTYRILGERLVAKGLISEEQAANLRPEVTIRGTARDLLIERSQQTNVNDSLMTNMTELLN